MTRTAEKVIWKDESYAIIGACFAVYKDKGRGFIEPVYHEYLEIEFDSQRIPFLSKPPHILQYRGRTLVQTFTPDFICYGKIVVEIKAVSALVDEHRAQLLNYLNATGCELGLLVNFGHYPGWNTSVSSGESKNSPMFISETLVSFRVFSGPKFL